VFVTVTFEVIVVVTCVGVVDVVGEVVVEVVEVVGEVEVEAVVVVEVLGEVVVVAVPEIFWTTISSL